MVAQECTVAEWWVHSRPFCNGHQFHYDSDETNTSNGEKPQHPLVSAVVYCTEPVGAGSAHAEDRSGYVGMGGPTLVTNQVLADHIDEVNAEAATTGAPTGNARLLANRGWLCYPRYNRAVMFNSKYLHGVVPGRNFAHSESVGKAKVPVAGARAGDGSSSGRFSNRRLTFMVGFWKKICAVDRGVDSAGPGQPFPVTAAAAAASAPAGGIPLDAVSKYTWPLEMPLTSDFSSVASTDKSSSVGAVRYVAPVAVSPIWQPIRPSENQGAEAEAKSEIIPSYDKCFQGF